MAARRRLDLELVRRGLVDSREQARRLIDDDRVTVSGAPATKPSHQVAPGDELVVLGPPPRYVSRGGEKLAGAIERFAVDVVRRRALDAGSSTGGFTDCLLQAGAAEVVAVDVGRAQLHQRLRTDPRVVVREQTDVRRLDVAAVGGPVDVVVADLSFISLGLVLDALVRAGRDDADWLLLVKPQFEAGRVEASVHRGVIRDPEVRRRAVAQVSAAIRTAGLGMMGLMQSPITGTGGNVEVLVHARRDRPGLSGDDLDAAIWASVAEPT